MSTAIADPRVVIILVNWNGLNDTLACLGSLAAVSYPACEVVVVDNGSTDGSLVALRAAFPAATLLDAGQNLGFVGGNNLGLEYALRVGADFALLLNNDTEVEAGFLEPMIAAAQSTPDVGIVGPAIYYYDQPDIFWSAGGKIDWARGTTAMIGLNEVDCGQFEQAPHEVDFVTGCALLIRMEAVRRAGMLDPRFFAYYEETEWCVRVQRSGYQILFTPQSKIWHKISIKAREASPSVHYYMTRNRLLFLKLCNAGRLTIWRALLENARMILSWTLKPRWRNKRPQRASTIRGVTDFARGRFGKMELAGKV